MKHQPTMGKAARLMNKIFKHIITKAKEFLKVQKFNDNLKEILDET